MYYIINIIIINEDSEKFYLILIWLLSCVGKQRQTYILYTIWSARVY